MSLASFQFWKLGECKLSDRIDSSTCGKCNQDLVCVKTRILAVQVIHFQFLDRFNCFRRDDMDIVVDAGKFLQYVYKKGSARTEQVGSFSGDDASIFKLQCGSRSACLLSTLQCFDSNFSVRNSDSFHIHKKLDLLSFFFRSITFQKRIECCIVASDDLLAGSFTAGFIITDTISGHIYPHVCR